MVKSCCQLSFLSLQALRVGNADVTSCLQCVSSKEEPVPACEQGQVDQAKQCEEGRRDGCQVQVESDSSNNPLVWHRDCCGPTTGGCSTAHESGKDRISCTSTNCNTMDPRSSAQSLFVNFSILTLCAFLAFAH